MHTVQRCSSTWAEIQMESGDLPFVPLKTSTPPPNFCLDFFFLKGSPRFEIKKKISPRFEIKKNNKVQLLNKSTCIYLEPFV